MPEDRRWTDTDRELAARAMYESWHSSVPFADQAADVRAEYLTGAGAVLDAFTAAGKLTGRRVDDALAIHRPANDWSWQTFGCKHDGVHRKLCTECKTCYPCRTVIALRGEIDG